VLRAEVGFHNRLPRCPGPRCFRGESQALGHLPESLAQRLQEQFVLAPEMLVEASMGQASVPHNG
jgi:hypothetical protein